MLGQIRGVRGMAGNRRANPELKLDVDLMILDYLVYNAIKGVLNERLAERAGESPENPEGSLNVVNTFISLFKANHTTNDASNDLQAKVQMLTFSNLFFRRYKTSEYQPSVQTLQRQRDENRARAKARLQQYGKELTGCDEETSNSSTSFSTAENRRDMLAHMGISPDSPSVPSLDSAVSSLDAVPELMALYRMVSPKVKPRFNDLTTVFMHHAALEQILVYGRPVREAVDETFAWSWMNDTETPGRDVINTGEKSTCGTNNLRESTAEAILRAGKAPVPSTEYRKLLHYYPLFDLEGSLLIEMKDLLSSLDIPILTQLEEGKLDGLSRSETESFKKKVGIL